MIFTDIEIPSNTDLCNNNFACINCENFKVCTVTNCIGNRVIFIDKRIRNCQYNVTFGNKSVCSCPLRREIYLKYQR